MTFRNSHKKLTNFQKLYLKQINVTTPGGMFIGTYVPVYNLHTYTNYINIVVTKCGGTYYQM